MTLTRDAAPGKNSLDLVEKILNQRRGVPERVGPSGVVLHPVPVVRAGGRGAP